ncbi:ATP-binding cassette domain-containing protein [Mycoplasma crocodyli]|uniref:Oligopeptide ABC transporter, ATP-binding protein OppF n=1 Tax=Mycoplasma crocodyli (strain ATCC 51981 / MP145) TaxID=512564 RepID=D5E632_MYCCM|nr:ATP-binding cassette domain-containing protein [Mycoplasma crocodyli]ADE19374.1 oligopeptide ABC transporter, ATP-binding protein OppF [Mycoplasma crocodyli MP145]
MKENKKVVLGIENLKKYFINKSIINKAVDGVSFNVHEGEIVGLIGESGSGKTTVGRSLLRLYDDVDGFITLDGKIISGKKITRERKRFLHKNIQMIFQDPHASLNGQKTIFSILKEPLMVNGVVTEKIKEIKSDWALIQDNFHYSFKEHAKRWELENISLIIDVQEKFIETWTKKFEDISFNLNMSNEDNFNSYYSYLEDKNNNNSIMINKLYTNTDKLVKYFYKKQNEYRSKVELDVDEYDLIKAHEEYEQNLKLSKHSRFYNELSEKIKAKQEELKEFKKEEKDLLYINKNAFKSFVDVYKNDTKYRRNNSLSTTELDFFFHSKKLELVSNAAKKITKSSSLKLKYLSFEEVKQFASELEEYLKVFYDKNLNVDETKYESVKKMNQITKDEFHFGIEKFEELSKRKHQEFKTKLAKLEEEIKKLEAELKDDTSAAEVSQEQLKLSFENLQKAEHEHKIQLDKFLSKFRERIAQLDEEKVTKVSKIQELSQKINDLDKKFKETHKKFVDFYEKEIIAVAKNTYTQAKKEKKDGLKSLCFLNKNHEIFKAYKQKEVELDVYKTNVAQRIESIKSFNIEKKYINNDLSNIDKLLGIHSINLLIKNVKNEKIRNILNKLYSFVAIRSIKKLFIKNTIYKSLEDVGLLKQFAYRYPHEFSGGQRQRIVIARALITNPKVIVADEPIASLDISIQAQVVNLLKDLCKQKNIGMLFIAHDLSMIEYVADQVQIMHLGKIVESGKTSKIYEKAIHPYTNNLFKAIPKISNATEKFQNVSFELSYLDEQIYPNVPEIFEVEPEHFVYGTKIQVDRWLKDDHFKATGLNKD